MGGKPDAEYYRKWRASHPEYRARQAAHRRERRRREGRGDRTAEYKKRAEKARCERLRRSADHGWLAESSIVRKARALAASMLKPDRRTYLWDDRHEDLVGVAVLALCEGKEPAEAMSTWLKKERSHRFYKWGSVDEIQEALRDPTPLPQLHGERVLRDLEVTARETEAVPELQDEAGALPPPHDLVHAGEDEQPD